MRGLALLTILTFLAITTLVAAQAGVLAWVWVSLMNPHREVYGFVDALRLNYVIALITVVAWLFSAEKKFPPDNRMVWAIGAFALLTAISTMFAWNRDFSYPFWVEFMKTCALLYLVACVLTNKIRIHALCLIIFISLAYWGVKGGGFSILSGGRYIVFGPVPSQIADNNHLALALTVMLPFALYLYQNTASKLSRIAIAGAASLSATSILLSYSRGAFLAILAVGLYWVISQRRFKALFAATVVASAAFFLLPDLWFERMDTIENYEEDRSVQGRFDAWRTSLNIAKADPLTGAGFTAIELPDVYFGHNPTSGLTSSKAAHSIWFQILGDHGFLGLSMYILLGVMAWRNLAFITKNISAHHDNKWILDLAAALRLSLIGFWGGGSFLSMGYYDLYFILLVMTGILRAQVSTESSTVT